MEEIIKTDTVEVAEPVAEVKESTAPSREELKKNGWSKTELDAAEKRGMIPKKEKKEEAKTEEKTVEKTETVEEKPEVKVEDRRAEPRPGDSWPTFEFKTPEQEKAFLDAFGPGTPQRAMVYRMKAERRDRQRAQQDLETARREGEELKARLEQFESTRSELDENGQDPDDKPLTMKQLREMRQQEMKEEQERAEKARSSAQRNDDAIRDQEEYAKAQFPDFEEVVKAGEEVIQNLATLQPWEQAKAKKLIYELQVAARNADKFGVDDYNAALIAYELGKMNPNRKSNGKKAETHNDGELERPDTKANGSLTPDQMKRIEANTQRRASSASIPGGGGKRTISVDDMTLAELNRMPIAERQKFREKHPEQFKKLLRG